MNPNLFADRLKRIRALVHVQRLARRLLRAAWLAGAGILLGWGLRVLSPNTIDERLPIFLGALLALPSLVTAFIPIPMKRFAWHMDRRLKLREQASTAWQAVEAGANDSVTRSLYDDAARILLEQQARMLRRGWFLLRGGIAALLIAILLGAVSRVDTATVVLVLPDPAALSLPPIPEEITREDVFPSGIPGLTGDPGTLGGAGEPGRSAPEEGRFSLDDVGGLQAALNNFGADLSQLPETFDAGQALQLGDLEAAAQAIEALGDRVDLLSEAARNNLEQALGDASQGAQNAGEDGLAEDFERAATSLDNLDPDNPITADALDQLADDLRDLGKLLAAAGANENAQASDDGGPETGGSGGGEGAGAGSSGQTAGQQEPFTRLEGEGDPLELEGGTTPSGLLRPGQPSGDAAITGGTGAVDGLATSGADITNGVLTPFHYSWDWRDVVSQYFTPR